jgi:hypothetical protein
MQAAVAVEKLHLRVQALVVQAVVVRVVLVREHLELLEQ